MATGALVGNRGTHCSQPAWQAVQQTAQPALQHLYCSPKQPPISMYTAAAVRGWRCSHAKGLAAVPAALCPNRLRLGLLCWAKGLSMTSLAAGLRYFCFYYGPR